jgi:hypothetical protein
LRIAELIGGTTLPDRILLVFLLAITGAAVVLVPFILPHGGHIRIEVKNKLVYTNLPLNEDKTIRIDGLTVEIRGGKVRVAESDCPGKICVKQGWIDSGAIICLPNRVVITVEGTSTAPGKGVDATT